MGLVILAQALEVAALAQTMDQNIETFLNSCPADFVDGILEKVKNFYRDPHNAYYAVLCLASLCNRVPSTKDLINRSDVEMAHVFGDSCHLALKKVTEKLLVSLQA